MNLRQPNGVSRDVCHTVSSWDRRTEDGRVKLRSLGWEIPILQRALDGTGVKPDLCPRCAEADHLGRTIGEEIMRQDPNWSLFVWGTRLELHHQYENMTIDLRQLGVVALPPPGYGTVMA